MATLKKLIKYWPVGSYLVMKSNPIVPGSRTLMSIGYALPCEGEKRVLL